MSIKFPATASDDDRFYRSYGVEAPSAARLQISGIVINGDKLARTIGFPTEDMRADDSPTLRRRTYAARSRDALSAHSAGVASFRRQAAVTCDGHLVLETYVIDFTGDFDGQERTANFVEHPRDESKFAKQNAKDQTERDVSAVRRNLKVNGSESPSL